VGEAVKETFRLLSDANDVSTAGNQGLDYYNLTYGNPSVPVSQHIGGAIDIGIPLMLLVPSLAPVAVPATFYEVFVFTGEVITGRPASDSGPYVEGLKERARNGWKIPGYNFSPALKPTSPGSSNGPVPGSSGTGGSNGQPQPQKNQGGGSGGGSQSYSAQIASIQAQIRSIQTQINQYIQSRR
jgi:hypothetical protein